MIDRMNSPSRRKVLMCLAFAIPVAGAACGTGGLSAPPGSSSPSSAVSASPQPITSLQAAPTSTGFHSSISVIDAALRPRMASSWHKGCPVPMKDLRYLTMSFWGFDGTAHVGEMVVHRNVAGAVVNVFGKLFAARFPMQRMRLVDVYGGDDDRSMAANNTSAFNCRAVTGGTAWSQHAYGWAIDINPIQNPYVSSGGTVLPPAGAKYANRSLHANGMIHAGDVVVNAFTSVGWGWGRQLVRHPRLPALLGDRPVELRRSRPNLRRARRTTAGGPTRTSRRLVPTPRAGSLPTARRGEALGGASPRGRRRRGPQRPR